MREALRQARKGRGRTSPNPMVGAVLVRGGEVIATGYHRRAGMPHAEAEALAKVGGKAPGCTLYVTLEPCNHHGRTPPCTEAIVKSGVRRVVVGMRDVNPDVPGKGCEYLMGKGIEVVTGVLEEECGRLNEVFIRYVTAKRPFVILKAALTLDGRAATATGHSQWVTNEQSRRFVHRLRDRVDALLVGVGTVLTDDPLLTTRLPGGRGRDPIRVVADTHLRTPPGARILHHDSPAPTLIAVGSGAAPEAEEPRGEGGVSILPCPTREDRIDLSALMGILAERMVTSLLVEGGPSITGSMLREHLVDKCYIFTAPKLMGGDDGRPMATGPGPSHMDQCITLRQVQVRRFGGDILTVGYPDYGRR